jgi:hypothetical protein
LTTTDLLKQLQEISRRHLNTRPKIAIDSLVLAVQVQKAELTPHLSKLEQAGFIQLDGNSVTITDHGIEALA